MKKKREKEVMNFWKLLKIYLGFCWETKARYTIFLCIIIIAAVASRLAPFFYQHIIDAAKIGDYDFALYIAMGYACLFFLDEVIANIRDQLNGYTDISVTKLARERYVNTLRILDYSYHANKSSGALISLSKRGDSAITTMVDQINTRGLEVCIGFLFTIISLLFIAPMVALIFVVALCLAGAGGYFCIRYNMYLREKATEEDDKLTALVVDNMVAFENIKFFAKSQYEQHRLSTAHISWERKWRTYIWTFRLLNAVVGTIMTLMIAAVLYITILGLEDGSISLGTFVLILTFLTIFIGNLWETVYKSREFAKSYTDLKQYFSVMELTPNIIDPKHPKKIDKVDGDISFKNVSFAFEDHTEVLNNISLTIHRGETVALVGKSGGGKTTLTRLLMRLYDVDKGEILVDGTNIKDVRQEELRRHIGLVPQEATLFNESIKFNIGYAKEKATLKEIKEAAKLAQLDEFIESLPEKYDTIVGERGIKLSGGQKQRLAIARVLLYDPEIIIFDEATSQLDSENEKKIQAAFENLTKNKTTIIIAHRLSTIMHADKIVVMEKGSIKEMGTHKDLLDKQGGLYKKLWGMQTDGIID